MDSPMIQWFKSSKASWIACISNTLKWRFCSSFTKVSWKCAPQPVLDVSVYIRRDGGGTWRGAPDAHLSCNHYLTHQAFFPWGHWCRRTVNDWKPTWLQLTLNGLHLHSASWNKLFQQCHAVNDLLPHPRRRQQTKEAVCHFLKSGNSGSFGKTLSQIVSISIPIYWTLLAGSRSNFSQLMTIPKSWQKFKRNSCCFGGLNQ